MRACEFLLENVYDDLYDDVLYNIMSEFRSGNNTSQKWSPVKFELIKSVWEDASKMGFVRNEAGLNKIADHIIHNVVKLLVNTDLMGHTSREPNEILEYNDIDPFTDEEYDRFSDWIIDKKSRQWRISDYGLDKLVKLANKLIDTTSSDDKLVIIDTILSVSHQRSDLAALFIDGGQKSLDKLSGVDENNNIEEGFNVDASTIDATINFNPEKVTIDEFNEILGEIRDWINRGVMSWKVNGKEVEDGLKAAEEMKRLIQHRIDAKKKETDDLEKKWAPHRWDADKSSYANIAEMVPIWWLKQLKGNDLRTGGTGEQNIGYNPETDDWDYGDLEALAKSIKERGIQEPVMISVGLDGYAYIGEGNHRIEAAEMAGLKSLPTRVWMATNLGSGTRGKGQYTHDVRKDITWSPDDLKSYPEERYYQKPSQVFKSLAKDKK